MLSDERNEQFVYRSCSPGKLVWRLDGLDARRFFFVFFFTERRRSEGFREEEGSLGLAKKESVSFV